MNIVLKTKCFKNVLYKNPYKNINKQLIFNKRQYSIPNTNPQKNNPNENNENNGCIWFLPLIIAMIIISDNHNKNRNINRY